ncbi:hypothetical protein DQ04_00061020 [Trypanosoma grayi]|uniref:hypothetical protein n=1 Tax=Trypanosoma grayi TaxID=71804 RepID=UPI0004F4589C|nr:hypothetical protein DQ04_00061020 [Trypanosoma grayi]KEG15464.1 hypothetical protein DQ04_00061020 [Trypanosoma grayi]
MEHTRRKEQPSWLNPSVHVWTTKNDISVVNLRDVTEQLWVPKSAFRGDEAPQTPEEDSLRAESVSSSSEKAPEPINQEPLGAILALIQRRSENHNTCSSASPALPTQPYRGGGNPNTEPETRAPSFPEPTPAKAMDVEFVQGVNLPGERNITSSLQAQQNTVQTVALFHDPVWGDVGSSYDIDSFTSKEKEKNDIFSSLKLSSFMEDAKKNEGNTTESTATVTEAPPPFTATSAVNEVMFQTPAPPTVLTSPPQIAYPPGIGLGSAGWTVAPQHSPGMAMQPFQFLSLPIPFMSQGAMVAMPQAYRMPYQFYQMHPQAPHHTTLQHQSGGAYKPAPTQELHQMQPPKNVVPQNPSPRPGTNVGAAPFVPGGKSV